MLEITDRMFVEAIEKDNNSVVITDDAGVISYVNQTFLDITGYTKDEVIGKHTRILKSGESPEYIYKELWETISSGKNWEGQFINKKKNGVYFWERANITPIFDVDDKQKIIGYVAIKTDITKQKLYEQNLEQSNLTKTKLLSVVSHDLKSPFLALLGYTELLYSQIDDLDKSEIKNFSYEIFYTSKKINTLLINLLDWSRLQINNIKPNNIKINLSDFILHTFDILKILSDVKGVELVNEVDSDINVYVDEKMMYSILYNLLHNSIKFTPENGKISVSIINGAYKKKNRIFIIIKDTGIGMTPENISKLFVINNQYTTLGTNNESGSGLGLLIVKDFLQKMGGKIEVNSEKDKGTEIIFDVELYKT